jgi:hypothetical protein
LHLEVGFELSFRTSSRWRQRAKTVQCGNVTFSFPHPLDIMIGKLARLDSKDLQAFERVIELTGHPSATELKNELQNAVDLFRPAFEEDSANNYPDNTAAYGAKFFELKLTSNAR